MDFLDELGKKASEAYKYTADKTGKIAKETKLKFKMAELRNQVNDIYEEIGKKVYESHTEKEIDNKEEIEELCIKIDVINDEINSLLKKCLELKDKKQCPNCYTYLEKDYEFCPKCGKKQDDVNDVENLEDDLSEEPEESDELDEPIIGYLEKEKNSNETDDKKEKTEKEEKLMDSEEDDSEDNDITNLEKTVRIESATKEPEENDENK